MGKSCQHKLIMAWNKAAAKTLFPAWAYSQTMITRKHTMPSDHPMIQVIARLACKRGTKCHSAQTNPMIMPEMIGPQ